jgi:hypothetical protein
MKSDDLDRVLAHEDHLELRRARRADAGDGRCQILYHYQEDCDQCSRRTFQPHLTATRSYCRRCCPACAPAILRWQAS